jgi:hypothetical protein
LTVVVRDTGTRYRIHHRTQINIDDNVSFRTPVLCGAAAVIA